MYRYGDAFGGIHGMRVIQAGILDDIGVVNNTVLRDELFVPKRVHWIPALAGVRQNEAMPPPQPVSRSSER